MLYLRKTIIAEYENSIFGGVNLVSELAKQAVNIKCGFENAKMTGNYECAYALGIVWY